MKEAKDQKVYYELQIAQINAKNQIIEDDLNNQLEQARKNRAKKIREINEKHKKELHSKDEQIA